MHLHTVHITHTHSCMHTCAHTFTHAHTRTTPGSGLHTLCSASHTRQGSCALQSVSEHMATVTVRLIYCWPTMPAVLDITFTSFSHGPHCGFLRAQRQEERSHDAFSICISIKLCPPAWASHQESQIYGNGSGLEIQIVSKMTQATSWVRDP